MRWVISKSAWIESERGFCWVWKPVWAWLFSQVYLELPQGGSIIGLVRKQVNILALKSARRSIKLLTLLSPLRWYSSHILVCRQVSKVQTRTFAHLAAGCMRAKVCPLLYVNKGTLFLAALYLVLTVAFCQRGRQSL